MNIKKMKIKIQKLKIW